MKYKVGEKVYNVRTKQTGVIKRLIINSSKGIYLAKLKIGREKITVHLYELRKIKPRNEQKKKFMNKPKHQLKRNKKSQMKGR